jgi:UDP-N-acetylmuramate--alanine ligase
MNHPSTLPQPPAHVHFVGIGGIGMSGLARILCTWGYRVTGSDATSSALIQQLRGEGIRVQIGHEDIAQASSADLVVATAAVRESNSETRAAQQRNIPVIKRAELLGMVANDRFCVAVAGSHGKSSTSGMLVSALQSVGCEPSYAIGAVVESTGEAMVVEADEYDYSFLWLKPKIAVITNIDYDHPDLFPDQATYDRAFAKFARGMTADGVMIVNGDDPGIQRVLAELRESSRVVTYGETAGSDWLIDHKRVTSPTGEAVVLELSVPGRHNLSNATAALVAMSEMGVSLSSASAALGMYRGIGRRFELKGDASGVTVIDDYAHHPQEIAATIAATRDRYPGRRIVAAFQPHTYSRTKALLDPFARALSGADRVVVLDIYPARETDSLGISSNDIVRRIDGDRAIAGGTSARAPAILASEAGSGDIVLTMGAGDITLVGPKLLALLEERV